MKNIPLLSLVLIVTRKCFQTNLIKVMPNKRPVFPFFLMRHFIILVDFPVSVNYSYSAVARSYNVMTPIQKELIIVSQLSTMNIYETKAKLPLISLHFSPSSIWKHLGGLIELFSPKSSCITKFIHRKCQEEKKTLEQKWFCGWWNKQQKSAANVEPFYVDYAVFS